MLGRGYVDGVGVGEIVVRDAGAGAGAGVGMERGVGLELDPRDVRAGVMGQQVVTIPSAVSSSAASISNNSSRRPVMNPGPLGGYGRGINPAFPGGQGHGAGMSKKVVRALLREYLGLTVGVGGGGGPRGGGKARKREVNPLERGRRETREEREVRLRAARADMAVSAAAAAAAAAAAGAVGVLGTAGVVGQGGSAVGQGQRAVEQVPSAVVEAVQERGSDPSGGKGVGGVHVVAQSAEKLVDV